MSIINQMLRDLNERSKIKNDNEAFLSIYKNTRVLTTDKAYIKIVAILAMSVLLVISMVILSMQFIHKPIMSITKPSHPASTIANQPNKNVKPIKTNQLVSLTGMTITNENDTTNIRFLLTNKVMYEVESNEDNQLILTLENTRAEANLPSIDDINSAISHIKYVNLDNGTMKVILSMKDDAHLRNIALHTINKLPELEISLNYKAIAKEEINDFDSNLENETNTVNSASSVKKTMLELDENTRLDEAIDLIKDGYSNKGEVILKKLVTEFPQFHEARETLVQLYIDQSNYIKAHTILNEGLKQSESYIPFIELSAQLMIEQNKQKDALELLNKYTPSFEQYPNYHSLKAALYQQNGDYKLSAKVYEKLLQIKPDNGVWWMGLGISLENLGKKNQAHDAYAKATRTDNLTPELKSYIENRMTYL